jgi:hypothetical protein
VRIIQKQRPSSRRNVKRHSQTIAHTVLLPPGATRAHDGSVPGVRTTMVEPSRFGRLGRRRR